jgi:arylsulfatase A-like enzyme
MQLNLKTAMLAIAFTSVGESAPLTGSRPNVVFILTDDQGYGDLSCHGNPILQTPNLDRLHHEGSRFTDFTVSPTCAPTRSALLTGRHEFRNGITHTILERERLSPQSITLPSLLQQSGYHTGIFGKWHLGDETAYRPESRGFEEVYIHGAGGIGQTYPGSCGDAPGNLYQDPWVLHNGKFEQGKGYCTDVFFSAAFRWIEKQVKAEKREPFYCHIATNAPHAPLQVRPEDEARYAKLVPNTDVAKFFGMVANIDDNVGRLLEKLQALGIEKETLVVFMNDNGGTEGCAVHTAGLRGKKGTPWQGGTKASSLWRWPGTLPAQDIAHACAHIDFFPTLLELAGAKLSKEVAQQNEGRSLLPILENPQAAWPDRLLVTHVGRWPKGKATEHKDHSVSLREGRWTLVNPTPIPGPNAKKPAPEQKWELFDLQSDPGQTKNVAADHPQITSRLQAAYADWWKATEPLLINEAAPLAAANPFHTLFYQQFPDKRPPNAPNAQPQ